MPVLVLNGFAQLAVLFPNATHAFEVIDDLKRQVAQYFLQATQADT